MERSRQSIQAIRRLALQSKTKPTNTMIQAIHPKLSASIVPSSRPLASLSNNTMSMSTLSNTASGSKYESPYADLFDRMKRGESPLSSTESQTNTSAPIDIPKLKCGIPEYLLKFRTTCFSKLHLPPYVQQDEYKVYLTVSLSDIPLSTDLEHQILRQIVDKRYIPEKKELRLSCNLFASRIENKRHLCTMLDRIVLGAQRLAKEIVEEQQLQQQKS